MGRDDKLIELEKDMIALQTEVKIQFKELFTRVNNLNSSVWCYYINVSDYTSQNGVG